MTKLEFLFLAAGSIAFVTGTGMFSSRRQRARMSSGPVSASKGGDALEKRKSVYDAPLRIASVEVCDDRGARLCSGSTPTSFRIPSVEKGSFNTIDNHVSISTTQGHSQRVVLRAVPNGWYIRGQFIFGPKVGWIVCVPDRNALYYLDQSKVAAAGEDDPDPGEDNPNVSFVLLEDVPEALRPELQRLNLQ